jgi:PqqD family protein of HPr-rel-A system
MMWQIEAMGRFYDPGEGMVVYFDSASGDTHLISDFAAHLITQFAELPLGIETLIKQISPDIDVENLTELSRSTQDLLENLVDLDILKRV